MTTFTKRWWYAGGVWRSRGEGGTPVGAVSTVTAAFTATRSGLTVTVDGSATTDVGSTISGYAWTFGDGGTASGPTASHTYAAGGTYTVTLTATDVLNSSATTSQTLTVSIPTAAFTVTTSTLTASFDGSASSGNGSTLTGYAWDFGDGATGAGATTSHTYAAGGSYTVRLTVTDSAGNTATVTHPATVAAPVGSPTASFTVLTQNLLASFDGSASTTTVGTIASYAWQYGDGTTGTGRTSSHTYAASGTYTARLTVTDTTGQTATTTHTVTATAAPVNSPPVASFTLTPSGLGVSVNGSASSDSDGSVTAYAWTFGDGGTASGVTASHTYAAGGTYTVTLKVTDNAGATATTSKTVTLTAPATTFTIGTTKPSAANTGTGIVRAAPTVTASTADGTISNGVLTITKNLKDRIVPYRVKIGANNLTVENCNIKGSSANAPTGDVNLVDCGTWTGTVVQYNEIHSSFVTEFMNAIGPRNVTARRNNIHHVTDCFKPNVTSTSNNVAMVLEGNYVHDFMFYAPSTQHAATPLYTVAGVLITGPWAGVPWNHADGCQVEIDLTTGVRLYGNTIVATWATDGNTTTPLPNAIKELSVLMLNGGRNLDIGKNWFDGGEECVNNADANVTGQIYGNRFGRQMAHTSSADSSYYALMIAAAGLSTTGNVWEDTGATVPRRNN